MQAGTLLRRLVAASVVVVVFGPGAGSAMAGSTAACPSGAAISWARVQLFAGANCSGAQMVVKADDGAPDRANFAAFRNWDGKTYNVDDTRSSLLIAAGTCVRMFDAPNFGGEASTNICATGGRLAWNLDRFDDRATSMRVCTTSNQGACGAGSPPPPPAPQPPPEPEPTPEPEPGPEPAADAAPVPAAESAVRWALAKVGTRECAGEQPSWVSGYRRGWGCATNWCGIFVSTAYGQAGVDLGSVAYTEDIFNRARRGQGLREVPTRQVRRGDLVLMYTYVKRGRRVTHVGLATGGLNAGKIPTVEGNVANAVIARSRSVTASVGDRRLVQMVVRVGSGR